MLDTHWRFFSRVDDPRARFGHRGVALISDRGAAEVTN